MKKIILIMLVCTTTLTAYANSKTTTITGKLEGLSDGAKVTLTPGGTHVVEASVAEATVTEGTFQLSISLEEPRVFYLRAEGNRQGNITLMVAPGDNVEVTGTFQAPVITGSKVHEEYLEKIRRPRAEMDRRYGEMREQYAELSEKMAEARRNRDTVAQAAIRASEEWKAFGQAERGVFDSLAKRVNRVFEENTNTFWGPLVLMSNMTYLTPENERQYNMLSDEAKKSFYGKAMAVSLFGPVALGEDAPDFTAKDVAGKEYGLKNLLKGDNYLLIDFWATWCGPCVNFMPTLKGLAEKYAEKGLVVVGISTDSDRNAWQKFLEKEQKPWLNLLDESDISKAYGVTSIPSIFLINPKGELVFSKQYGQSVIDKLKDVFGE